MRLGEQACVLQEGTNARRLYDEAVVHERHRHRYEVNNRYIDEFQAKGLIVAGRSEDGELVEMVEQTRVVVVVLHTVLVIRLVTVARV